MKKRSGSKHEAAVGHQEQKWALVVVEALGRSGTGAKSDPLGPSLIEETQV
jgi:hypothetical protein